MVIKPNIYSKIRSIDMNLEIKRRIDSTAEIIRPAFVGPDRYEVENYIARVRAVVEVIDTDTGIELYDEAFYDLTPPEEKTDTVLNITEYQLPPDLLKQIKQWLFSETVLEGIKNRLYERKQNELSKTEVPTLGQTFTEED
jgi:hypothetical protein